MCYTLPTPDDPFNEKNDRRKRRQENRKLRTREVPEGEILEFETHADVGSGIDANGGHEKRLKKRKISDDSEDNFEGPQDGRKRRKGDEAFVKEETRAGKHSRNGNEERRSLKLEDLQALNSGAPPLGKECVDANGCVISKMVLDAISESGLLSEDLLNGDSKKETKKPGSIFGSHCQAALAKGVDVVALSSHGWEERVLGFVVPAAVHIKAQLSTHAAVCKPFVLIVVASQDQALQVWLM